MLTSPVANATLALAGGFLTPGPRPAVMWQTVTDADGVLVSHQPLFGGSPVPPNASWVFRRAEEAPGLPLLQVLFTKVFN